MATLSAPETMVMKEKSPLNNDRRAIKSVHQRGFSLIEVVAALGVVATMLALVIPSLTRCVADLQAEGLGERD